MKNTTGVDWELMFAVNLKQKFIFIPSQMYKILDQAYKFDNSKKNFNSPGQYQYQIS